jgi:regulator of PEP synthase PpsR (kinase-PPPase family)
MAAVELHMISDSTGETAQRLVQALEAQFPEQEFLEIRHPRVESVADLRLAVDRMKGRSAVVVYTLVEPELREAMRSLCRNAKLHYCDLLGHPIEAVARVSGQAAKMKPRARPPLNDAYFRRMSAIEFAVKFDDGLGSGLADADIVLVGVSRTSKTPLSIYLGKGIDPPPDLFTIDQSKVVGLTIDAQRLSEIRGERIRWMRGDRKYADLVEIYDELDYATQMHRRLGCPVLEVSELSIEEIAHRIIQLVERRKVDV